MCILSRDSTFRVLMCAVFCILITNLMRAVDTLALVSLLHSFDVVTSFLGALQFFLLRCGCRGNPYFAYAGKKYIYIGERTYAR